MDVYIANVASYRLVAALAIVEILPPATTDYTWRVAVGVEHTVPLDLALAPSRQLASADQ